MRQRGNILIECSTKSLCGRELNYHHTNGVGKVAPWSLYKPRNCLPLYPSLLLYFVAAQRDVDLAVGRVAGLKCSVVCLNCESIGSLFGPRFLTLYLYNIPLVFQTNLVPIIWMSISLQLATLTKNSSTLSWVLIFNFKIK